MNTTLTSNNFLENLNLSGKTGHIEIINNGILWQLSLIDGKVEFATHSLQSGHTLKHFLKYVGNQNVDKYHFLSENKANIKHQISLLEQGKFITKIQHNLLRHKISEDAIESLYWLSRNNQHNEIYHKLKPFKWEENERTKPQNLIDLELLINRIKSRWLLWQQLSPIITSPHQIPVCYDPNALDKHNLSAPLSLKILKHLVGLMKGLSIRELALLIKQDELKLAQILSTYIKGGIIQLKSPKTPLNLLPHITASAFPNPSPIKIETIEKVQKNYTIVCIDDSPTMLEIIGSYLDANNYNLIAISDPMKSVSFLFKSNPDLIIMDVSMPGINGNRLCKILKSSPIFRSIPIILISGEKNIPNDILVSTGARDFLAKPFEKTALINLIHKYC